MTIDFKRGHRAAVEKMMARVQQMIDARREWAESDEGRQRLGPGSTTIPGLQDMHAMRDYLVGLAEIK